MDEQLNRMAGVSPAKNLHA